ncbi:hypothetical protein R3X25_11515 [Lutibacter sp. TH_r2]|uniref:hypothetical protein n=1 Tax=Lutibacter sp. TH_r2 TaxID=3082083 RepID=UPI002953862D|nr:hypothetical protein [Lutibacter sp. TH_r2]MDV7187910.1 hypothetical protein [Lutibacter sp. TH_r2]
MKTLISITNLLIILQTYRSRYGYGSESSFKSFYGIIFLLFLIGIFLIIVKKILDNIIKRKEGSDARNKARENYINSGRRKQDYDLISDWIYRKIVKPILIGIALLIIAVTVKVCSVNKEKRLKSKNTVEVIKSSDRINDI